MKTPKNTTPIRTALIYALFGILWILVTDFAVFQGSPPTPAEHYVSQSFKGIFFVLVSAALIYLILRRDVRELQASVERYRLLYEASLDAVMLTDPADGGILAANPAACKMFGRTEEEIKKIGRTGLVDFTDPRLKPALEERARTGHFIGELTMLRRDGTKFPGEISSSLFTDKDGNTNTSMIVRDISRRKQAEDSHRESEERFSKIFHASPFAMHLFRFPDGKSVIANEAFLSLTGYADDELIGHTAAELNLFVDPNLRNVWMKELRETGSTRPQHILMRIKSGEIRDVSAAIETLEVDGEKMGLVMAMDITERRLAEAALKENEERLELVLEGSQLGYWDWNIESGEVHRNARWAEMLGYTLPEIEFNVKQWTDLHHPDDRERAMQSIQDHLDGKTPVHRIEYRMKTKDGSYKWILDQARVVKRDAQGKPIRMSGTHTDITELKQAEAERAKSFELAQRVFHSSPLSTVLTLLPERTVIDANEAFVSLFGYVRAEVVGKPISQFDLWADPIERELAAGALIKNGEVFGREFIYKTKTGQTGTALFYAEMFEQAGERYVLTKILDITERKQAEERLRESEERYRQLLNVSPIGVAVHSAGRLVFANMAGAKIIGAKDPGDIVGKPITEVIHPDNLQDAIQRIQRMMAGETGLYPVEDRYLRLDGSEVPVEVMAVPLTYEGSPAVQVIIQNITERKQAENKIQLQLQRMSALGEIDRAISSSLDMRLSLDVLLGVALSQLGVDAASVLLLNPFNQTLEYISGKGFRTLGIRQSRVQLGEGLAGKVGLDRKSLYVSNFIEAEGLQIKRFQLINDEEFVEYYGIPLVAKGALKGVLEIFNRTPLAPDVDWLNYLDTLGGQAAIAIDNVQLFEGIQQSNLELITAYDATIEGWSHAMDMRDKETEGHTLRVTELTVQLAKKMGIGQQEIVQMRRGALLHDIGKLGVPDNILLKPDALTKVEWAIMRQHPSYAFNMLMSINYLRAALDIPYCHHEKWDGSGYPRGLKGEEIPMAARLFAVIDVWDALRSDRPYRAAWTIEKTREHIIEGSGSHFDPQVVVAFLSLLDESPDMN